VVGAGDGVVKHLLLAEGVDEHMLEALAEAVESVVGPPCAEELESPAQRKDNRTDPNDRENPEPDDTRDTEERPCRGVMHATSFKLRSRIDAVRQSTEGV